MANNKKNLTVFQKLGLMFSPDGVKTPQKNIIQNNKYSINPNQILKTTDKNEFELAKKTAQQNKYLNNLWHSVGRTLTQNQIQGEATRIASYMDFENMEYYPLLSAALDVFSEEACTLNNNGRMMNIYSDSKRVKQILEDLFFNRLDLHTSLPMWTRNVCKYGENFTFLNIDNKLGIKGVKQMPNFEMIRTDADLFGGVEGDNKTKFIWNGRNKEFNSWQIAHFRLLTDDRKLPYGTSILEKARKIYKQLIMSEDAMLVYRLTRAAERRVYKIYVGNIDENDVQAYVNEIANRFKRTPLIDPQTGQLDLKFNQMPVWKKTPIPLLDGRTISIEELAKEYDEGKENWVYSVQDNSHQIVSGKVKWCGKNYTAKRMIKVILDDDTYIITAEEHPFLLRDGTKKRADELKENDSLMPFYTDFKSFNSKPNSSKYETIFNPNSGKYEFTHRLIAKEIKKIDENFNTIHHIDFKSKNNTPNNLTWVDYYEHIKYHVELSKQNWKDGKHINTVKKLIEYNKSEKKKNRNIELAKEQNWVSRFVKYNNSDLHTEHNLIRKEAQIKDWSNPEKKELRSKGMRIVFDDLIWNLIRDNIIKGVITNRKTLVEFLNTESIIKHVISINKNKRLNNQKRIERTVIERQLNDKGFKTITEYITENKKNHKVKSVEFIGGDDVYCMTVIGQNGEDDRHNFALKSFKANGEISESGVFVKNSNDQDFFIPVRDENAPNPIDTLPAAQNLNDIADITYLRDNLFTAIRVPKTFLGFEDSKGEGKNLSLQDVRFARTVNRIQQTMLQELNKIAMIHLSVLGFDDELDNFTLTLNNPSTQAEMLKVEHMQQKVTLYKDMVSDGGNGFSPMSMTRAKREIFNWSDDDIKQDLLEQRMEKAASTELANTSAVIKHTGAFDKVDIIYGDIEKAREGAGGEGGEDTGSEGGGSAGGGFGGGGMGSEDLDFGDESALGGETEGGEGKTPETGTEQPENTEQLAESLNKKKKLISDSLDKKKKKYSDTYFNKLINYKDKKEQEINESIKIEDKNLKINEDINNMINGINDLLKEDK